jgi:hypothetical protein
MIIYDNSPISKWLIALAGVSVMSGLVVSDARLRQLFHRHGGHELLVTLASAPGPGVLRAEAVRALKATAATRPQGAAGKEGTGLRRAQSAPMYRTPVTSVAGGGGFGHEQYDIWAQVSSVGRNSRRRVMSFD